jgi:surfactin synthase thioesterase subunit
VTSPGPLRRFTPRPWATLRLFCFPHAGGAASAYRAWPALLPETVDVFAVQYPGREDRLAEPRVPVMDRLADHVAEAVDPSLDRPFAFFGHSMGAAVAYEVAHRITRREPERLFVSAREAPHRSRSGDLHRASDAALLAELTRLGGSARELLDEPELRALVLPIVRDDYRLIETYRPAPRPPLACPVTVFRGDADPEVTAEDARAWQTTTTGAFEEKAFPGGHFYLVPHRHDLTLAIAGVLRPHAPQGRS